MPTHDVITRVIDQVIIPAATRGWAARIRFRYFSGQ
jgi:hypothetical protein